MVGGCVGLFFGALAWLDSGMIAGGLAVFAVLGVAAGVWMARRILRYWTEFRPLTVAQRRTVVDTVWRGAAIEDPGLAPAALAYGRALAGAVERYRVWRPLVALLLLVALASAIWDATHGSTGNLIVSVVYLVFVVLEVFWWPGRRARLSDNAERAVAAAQRVA